jgi:hypothetical protein
MALQETYYAVHEEHSRIPDQHEWYDNLEGAREDAVTDAENSSGNTYIVTEILTRALFATKASITLEAI